MIVVLASRGRDLGDAGKLPDGYFSVGFIIVLIIFSKHWELDLYSFIPAMQANQLLFFSFFFTFLG